MQCSAPSPPRTPSSYAGPSFGMGGMQQPPSQESPTRARGAGHVCTVRMAVSSGLRVGRVLAPQLQRHTQRKKAVLRVFCWQP